MSDIVIGAPAWGENICPECGKKEKRYYMGSWDWEPEVCVECKVKKLERDLEVKWREKYYDKVQELKLAEEKLDVLEDCVAEMRECLGMVDAVGMLEPYDRIAHEALTSVTKKLEALEQEAP